MNAHELLVAGRNRLARGHLAKYRLRDRQGGYCVRGCFMESTRNEADVYRYDQVGIDRDEIMAVDRALADALGVPHCADWRDLDQWAVYVGAVINFNNAESTTKEDVLALLDKAIAATAPQPDTSFLTEVEEAIPA